ncbi:MAG TPA: TonB-dependent receptor, partial [Blastocatellia bacterium]
MTKNSIRSIPARIASVLVSLIAAGLTIMAQAGFASAQSPDVGAVRGQVVDQTGAAISDSDIVISNESTGLERKARTDNGGHYTIEGLPLTGHYRLTVSKSGFDSQTVEPMDLRAGEVATVNVTMGAAGSTSEVTVFGTAAGLRSDSPDMETRLDLQKIDNTPVFGRNITELSLLNSAVRQAQTTGDLFLNNTLFVINGNGRRETTFTIDGSDANDSWGRQSIFTNLPLASIQEFTVMTNAFSSEYGWSTAAVVNVITLSGTNTFHGDFLALWRPPGIQARSPESLERTADRLEDYSGAFSGPIIEDRTHFFVSGEYFDQHRDSTITSPIEPGHFTGSIHRGLFLSRLDHQINDTNTLTGRINFDRDHDTNPQDIVGGNSLPSTDRIFQRKTYEAALSETAVLSSNMLNEARVQAQLGEPITKFDPVDPSPQFVYPGVATAGESRFGDLYNHQYEAADTFSVTKGAHLLKFGIDAIHSTSGGIGQEFGTGFVLGQFTLRPGIDVPVADLTIADVASFTQSFGNANYQVREWLWSVFAQDDYKIRPDLTLNMGVRYEQQTFTQDPNNVAPRIGFAYNILGDDKTVLRGGYGIYYIEIPADFAAAANINGPNGTFTFTATPGQLGFPTSLAPLPAFPPGAILPPRNIDILPGRAAFLSQFFDVGLLRGYPNRLLNPYEQQFSLAIDRRFGSTWQLSVAYIHQRTLKLDRPDDLNAPAPFNRTEPGQVRPASVADLTRPIIPA